MSPAALSLAVVGSDHPNKRGPTRRFAIALCRPGDPVQLVPEPKSPVDPNAIQVTTTQGIVMGYVRANRAVLIQKRLREGDEIVAVFQSATDYGALIRVSFDGSVPKLPIMPAKPPESDGFYPDEVWPDDISQEPC